MRNEKIEKKNENEREKAREKLSSWFNASYEQSVLHVTT